MNSRTTRLQLKGRLHRAAVSAAAVVALSTAPAAADHGSTTCRGQDVPISKHTLADSERTSLCLLNLYRQANGLGPLGLHRSLERAAGSHSADMVKRGYFDHVSPDGKTPQDRADAAGYRGSVGENIIASGNPHATPHDLFNLWRRSEGHNNNMLSLGKDGSPLRPPYEAAGIGLALGAPEIKVGGKWLGPQGVTGTQLFGTRATGSTATGLELAGGDPHSTRACKPARRARGKARRAWRAAKESRRRVQQQLKRTTSKHRRGELAGKLKRKRKAVAKARAELRRATDRQRAVC